MYTLFVSRGYPTKKYKMNGIFEFDQAKALVKANSQVVFAAVDLRSVRRWRSWGVSKSVVDGVYVYEINVPLGITSKKLKLKIGELALNILYKKIEKDLGVPDVIHGHFSDHGHMAAKLSEKTQIPLVVSEHSSLINKEVIDPVLYAVCDYTYHQANALIAVSPAFKAVIKKQFQVDSIYIPNIVDLDIFKYQETKNNEKTKFNFTSVGNLKEVKRFDLLLMAFAAVFKDNKDVSLTIFGDGVKKQELLSLLDKLDLSDQVSFEGMQSREVISKHYLSSDCFVLASQSETFGVAYIEALAMGLPVIATKSGGPEGFVKSSNGILIDVDSQAQLEQALLAMYKDAKNYSKDEIVKDIKAEFSAETVAKEILKVYNQVIKEY